MKFTKVFFSVLFFCLSLSAFSQKVKIKKDKAIIDDVELYNVQEQGTATVLASLDGKEFAAMLSNSYEEPNPARKYSSNYPATIKKFVFTVKFLDSGKELFTDMGHKQIIKEIYNSKMVDDQGNIDDEKLNVFINKFNNENLKYKLIN